MTDQQVNSKKPWLVATGATAIALASLFAKPHEGIRYVAYPDPATHGAPWTVCYGHTRGVVKGMTATQEQCDEWLTQDMAIAAQSVDRCISGPINTNQRAALDYLVFNLGPKVVCGSTLQRLANSGYMIGMCNQIPRWDKAGGKVFRGLTLSRMDSKEQCLYPVQP